MVNEKVSIEIYVRSSRRGSVINEPDWHPEDEGSIPGLAQWVKDPVLP